MRDKVYCGMLNAYYGSLLTEHQREVVRLYCDCDMSLSEVAEFTGSSRQAVREALVRSTDKLESIEGKLALVSKVQGIADSLKSIIDRLDEEPTEAVREELNGLLERIEEI